MPTCLQSIYGCLGGQEAGNQEMLKAMGVSYGFLQLQEAMNNKDLTAGVFWIMASLEF